jgi:hypothetical protein
MINYKDIWDSLNSESENNIDKTLIARRVPSSGIFPVFLATDFKKGIRLLYVKCDNDDLLIDNLPNFRGLEISYISASLGEFTNQNFLKFSQTIPNSKNVFELVISDICENAIRIQSKNKLSAVIIKTLNEWKLFFEKKTDSILSVQSQKGLFGELYFLKNILFQKYSYSESLLYWTGSAKTNHDFQIINNAVEIKTTSSKQHKRFIVSSEKQLDSSGLENLYLSLFSLNLHNNMPERTLSNLIKEINTILQNDSVAAYQFNIKIAKCGYDYSNSNKYLIGFSVHDVKFYHVMDGFPRLLQSDLPNGIGDLKYSVMVSACMEYEIKTEILNLI